jgi:HPt (histidine-containing phosphotransfer) domain-containing protein
MAMPDQPVDLHHLDRYTGGDRAINEEILRLFEDQCRASLAKLEELMRGSADAKSWREITHTLKGAARGVGAFDLGDAAAATEKAVPTSAQAELLRLKREAVRVGDFLAEFLRHEAAGTPFSRGGSFL